MEHTLLIPETEGGYGVFGTIVDLAKFMLDNDIPLHAEIQYSGCGSHRIEFSWKDKTTTADETDWANGLTGGLDLPRYNKWDYDNAGVPDE